jgi:hypothetical protein
VVTDWPVADSAATEPSVGQGAAIAQQAPIKSVTKGKFGGISEADQGAGDAAAAAPQKMNARRPLLLAWLAIAGTPSLDAAVLSEFAPLATRIGGPVSVPAEIGNNAMFVAVMVNGRGPFRMFVDTGCALTVVSGRVAAAAGAVAPIPSGVAIDARNGLGDPVDVRPVVLGSLAIGGARFEGVEAGVSASFDRISRIEGRKVDGALGYNLFADLYLTLDFPRRRMMLSTRWPGAVPPVLAERAVVQQSGVPFVRLRIQGKPVEVMIDTGSNEDLQLPSELSRAMQWKQKPRPGALVAVFDETNRETIGRLDGSLNWGSVRQAEPTTAVSTNGLPTIGLGFLRHFCVVFHEADDRVWLCSADNEPVPSRSERSIGLSLISEPAGWRVAGVIPGSPAEKASVKVGEIVTRIEGEPARAWTPDRLRDWIASHGSVALVVADGYGERRLDLPVWSLVP